MHGTNIVVLVNLIGKDLNLYDRFRLAIKSDKPNWKYSFIDNSLPFHTETVSFNNLEENERYTIIGQYCRSGQWFNIKEAIIPCSNSFNEDLNSLDLEESNTLLLTRNAQSQEDIFESTEKLHVALKIQPIIVSQHGCAGAIGDTGDGSGGEDPNPNTDPPNITSQYIIPVRPTQQTQNIYSATRTYLGEANSCVANAIAAAKEIQEQRQSKDFLQYSIEWLYGKFGKSEDFGMYYDTALKGLQNVGIPPYQVVKRKDNKNFYPDNEFFSDAQTIVNNTGDISKYTLPQKIASYKKYIANETADSAVTEEICDAIKNAGSGFNTTVLCTITIDKSFDKASGNGVVGALEDNYRGGHMMAVVGWATIDNKQYWIVQNSWTTANYYMSDTKPLGDNGLYYIPFDWYKIDKNNVIWGLQEFYILYDDPNAPELPPIETTTETYLKISSTRPDGKQYPDSVRWNIENLSNEFNTNYYIKAGITTYQFTQPSSTISGIVSEAISQSNGTNRFAYGYWNNLQYNTTYKVWGFVQAKNGIYYPMKNGAPVTFTTILADSFYWSYKGCDLISGKPIAGSSKNSNYSFYVGASEWNRLVQNVKDKLTRRGMYIESTYRLNEAAAKEGQDYSATKFNLVRRAIGALNSTGLNEKNKWDNTSADELNLLMNKINEVE